MGDPAMKDQIVQPPPTHVTPFLPSTPHPTVSDVEQMINTRVTNAVEQLRSEFHGRSIQEQKKREIAIGVAGAVAGAGLVYFGNRIMVARRNRANAAGR